MPAKRNAVLQDARIRVIRPNWCIQEHTSGIIDSSNSREQFSYSTKIELPSIQSSYIVRYTQECDACTELRSINSSVGSEKILHLCIEGKSIVSNAIARTVTWFETGQVKCWTLFISLNWVPQERTVEKQTSSVKMVWATAMTNDKSFLKAIDYVSLMLYDDV